MTCDKRVTMSAQSTTFTDTEQHWQELHQAAGHSAAELLKSATATLSSKPVLAVGGAAIAGFVLGKLILGNRAPSFTKFVAASAIPLASKSLHQGMDMMRDQMHDTRSQMHDMGKTASKRWQNSIKKASRWLHSVKP